MGRAPCCDKANVKRGPWSPEEDTILKNYVERYGTGGNWIALPHKAGLKRCGKSCRLRWLNYLRPDIKHGGFTEEEDNIICSLYKSMGSRWSVIASHLPGRTDNDVKNYWNTKLKKKLLAANSNPTSNANTASNKPTYTSSSPSVVPIVKTENYGYSFSPNFAQNSIQIPPIDAGFGYNVEPNRLFADPASIPQMGFKEMSEFSACTPNYSVSSSQEASGPLSSLPMDSNYISWSSSETDGLLMELSSGPPYDPFNGHCFPENMGEIAPNLANFFYANNMLGTTETKQQGLYQGVLS